MKWVKKMNCTFFGHRNCPETIHDALHNAIEYLIQNRGVRLFYVGNQGNFDSLVLKELRNLQNKYTFIQFRIVLAYIPVEKSAIKLEMDDYTIVPPGIENVPRRFAICYRNKWMIQQSQYVISYVVHTSGGAAQFTALAERQGKTVIRLPISK